MKTFGTWAFAALMALCSLAAIGHMGLRGFGVSALLDALMPLVLLAAFMADRKRAKKTAV